MEDRLSLLINYLQRVMQEEHIGGYYEDDDTAWQRLERAFQRDLELFKRRKNSGWRYAHYLR
jgi:hypothetical protein